MKKMYNQPQTDICKMQIEYLMLNPVSVNNGGSGGGTAHAPSRHGDIIE